MTVEVLVEIKLKKIDKTFTYKVPNNLIANIKIGKRVLIPFNNREVEGFVLKINSNQTYEYELKDIISIVDEDIILNNEMLKLGRYISSKTLAPLITVYQAMLPTALKAKKGLTVNKKYITHLKLNNEISDKLKLTKKQQEIIDILKENNKCLKSDLMKKSSYSVNSLLKKGIIIEYKEEIYRLNQKFLIEKNNIVLNKEQEKVSLEIKKSLGQFKPFLLHGVTGSGKTEVYINIIDTIIKNNQQAIVLVPEISLTPQIVEKFKKRFGAEIAILHSRLSLGEKYDEWRKINRHEVSIVIGARSAIFAPFTKIGVIIIDEEHSATYKQENIPRYNAIDVAIKRCQFHKCPLILGSATPSLESYVRAKMGIYNLLEIPNRINNEMPEIYLVDMKEEIKKNQKIFSQKLLESINERLIKNEQVILLLNRRGHSTVLICNDCGYTIKCPNCDIPLTYHKKSVDLRCHYCNYKINAVINCPSCNSAEVNYYGMGTQKLEEELNKLFLDAKIVRMDIDTTSKKGSHEQIINDFENLKHDILIGTQMISKGLDFGNVTLVGVINGDASLNIPDFRSAERTFQLLSQVAGRSGRGNKKGEVIIQVFNTDHYSIKAAVENNYYLFFDEEIKIRKKLKYPPFYNLALIKITTKDYDLGYDYGIKITNYLQKDSDLDFIILGPSSSIIPKINNIYYLQVVIKYKNTDKLIDILKEIDGMYIKQNKVTIDVDLNPLKI